MRGDDLLVKRAVPDLVREQVKQFTPESLKAKPTCRFDPQVALARLQASNDKEVISIDIGGDKLMAAFYRIRDGTLQRKTEEVIVRQSNGGSEYVDVLEELAGMARHAGTPVGISFAGPTAGTKLVAAPNLPTLLAYLHDHYGGDFINLFSSVALTNDAEAGLMAASLEAIKRQPHTRNVIYVINGSGLGGAVLRDTTVFTSEPGHIQVEAGLNRFNQRKPCGMSGATYTCLEAVAASKAGIEDIWLQQHGEYRSGREIAAMYLTGDQLALDLYDSSALVTAHVVKGLAEAFQLLFDRTSVVGHGGTFHVPGYGERLRSILKKDLAYCPSLLLTQDFSANACLDGAAIAAVMAGHEELRLAGSAGG